MTLVALVIADCLLEYFCTNVSIQSKKSLINILITAGQCSPMPPAIAPVCFNSMKLGYASGGYFARVLPGRVLSDSPWYWQRDRGFAAAQKWHEDHGKDEPVRVYPLHVCLVERELSPSIPKTALPFDTPVPQLRKVDLCSPSVDRILRPSSAIPS